jgi:hypothetical protein
LGWGAANKACTPLLAYDENALVMLRVLRLGGDLLLPSALFPLARNGDLDREGKGETPAVAKGEADPIKASKPVRLVAVLAGVCCTDHCEEAKPANGEGVGVLFVGRGEGNGDGDGDGETDSFLDVLELAPEKIF